MKQLIKEENIYGKQIKEVFNDGNTKYIIFTDDSFIIYKLINTSNNGSYITVSDEVNKFMVYNGLSSNEELAYYNFKYRYQFRNDIMDTPIEEAELLLLNYLKNKHEK